MAKRTKSPLTITWPDTLVAFIKGPVFDKTKIKPAQLSELAMEDWLKKHGYWDEYQNTLPGDKIKVISTDDNDISVTKGDKKIDPTALFGIWADKPRSLENIRKDTLKSVININSKLLNLSELARRLDVNPTTFYNRVNGIGKHKALNEIELVEIEQIIENELNLNFYKIL